MTVSPTAIRCRPAAPRLAWPWAALPICCPPPSHFDSSRRRDCHFDDTPFLSLLKHLLKVEGGATEWQSRRRLFDKQLQPGRM